MSGGHTASPHTTAGQEYAALDRLIRLALVEMGHATAGQISGEVMNHCIFCANQALEDVMLHPYWDGGEIAYYVSQDDRRPVPDPIMVYGIAAYLSKQQASQRMQSLFKAFANSMNQILLRKKYGPNPSFDMKVYDKG